MGSLPLACFNCGLRCSYPVHFVVDVRFHEVIVVHLKQESAALRDVVYIYLPPFISVFYCFTQFFSSRPPFLLIMECEISEYLLAVCYV